MPNLKSIKFEKKYGSNDKMEDMIINRRRIYYEKKLEENSMDYDTWFDYTKLEEDYKAILDAQLIDSRKQEKTIVTPFMQNEWKGFESAGITQMLAKTLI